MGYMVFGVLFMLLVALKKYKFRQFLLEHEGIQVDTPIKSNSTPSNIS